MSRYLELSIDGLVLRMERLTSIDSMKVMMPPKVEYSVNGSATVRGASYAPRFIWTATALLEESEADLLSGLFALQDRLRRTLQPFSIQMADTTRRFTQPLPVSRAVVAGTTPVIQGSIVSYFAIFAVALTPPEFSVTGKYFSTSFSAMEIENVA